MLKRLLLGRRLATSEQAERKLGVITGIPALGLDGLASSAYGPEALLAVLIPIGAAGLDYVGPITIAIIALLIILYVSYRQTISAYPTGGGSYSVARENLGETAGLIAAAALMIDYVLNVAVAVSTGVGALISAFPPLYPYTLPLCLGILLFIAIINLRGTLDAGWFFAIPTYLFVTCFAFVIGVGVVRSMAGGAHPVTPPAPFSASAAPVTIWILLHAFASGCTAMTGIEAVSNGVSAFRDPAERHARRTLTGIVLILAILLAGIAYLVYVYHIGAMNQEEPGYQSLLSQLVASVFGRGTIYYICIGSLLAVVCFSANTSFVDFPRLCRLIAADNYLPHAFTLVGRRLVFSVGIIFLTLVAALLLYVFGGVTEHLIPLFAVGAFLAFTLSQAGMVMHWRRALKNEAQDQKGSRIRLGINAVGTIATCLALAIILVAKFGEGAWVTVVVIPVLLVLFKSVKRHYKRVAVEIEKRAPLDLSSSQPPVVVVPTETGTN